MVAAARRRWTATDGGALMFTNGRAGQTLIWDRATDQRTQQRGVVPRARRLAASGNLDDYKTTSAARTRHVDARCSRQARTSVAWYLRGLRAVTGLDGLFRFAVQETYPPYALSVIGLGPDALMLAEKKCLYALEQWREARDRNDWIGYPRRTAWATLPMAHEAFWLDKETR